MNEDAKASLLLRYVTTFNHMGFFYFHLSRRECNTLYVRKLNLFKELLMQDIPNKQAAKEMMRNLSMSILKEYKGPVEIVVIPI